jgi:hypothetical protein
VEGISLRAGGARIALALFSIAGLCSCGGSNAGAPPALPDVATQATPNATTTQSVTASAGGKVTLSGSGAQVTVTIPAHALASDATVTLSSFADNVPQPANAGGTVNLPGGARFLAGFTISTGGVPLTAPLQVSETIPASGSGGSPAFLAMYSASSGRYTVVDSATVTSSAVSNDGAKAYVGVSTTAGATAPYVFYSSSATQAPPAISLVITAATPGPYAIGATAKFSAAAKDANGNGYAFKPAFSLSSSALGSVQASSSSVMDAVVTFGTTQQAGSITATDQRTGLSGSLDLSVQSERPATNGDAYAYSGTFAQEFDRVLPSPMPTAVASQNVTQTVTVKDGQTFQGHSNLYDIVSNETDVTSLQTVTSQANTFVGFSSNSLPASYLEYGSRWEDQNGNSISYVYATPRILDELPEKTGQSWTNSASASISENESVGATGAAFSSQRVYNADGTYTDNSSFPPGYFGIGSSSDRGVIVENADGSGYYSIPIYGAGDVVFGAPVNGQIPYQVYAQASPQPTDTPLVAGNIGAWYSAPTFYTESNVDNGPTAIPASCNASAAFGSNAEQIVQTINRLDTVLGYTEATTTTTYLVSGYGAVCIQMSDVTSSYYDFQGDSTAIFYSQPYQITKTSETLGLQQSGTSVIGSKSVTRSAASLSTAAYATIGNSLFARTLEKRRSARARAIFKGVK